MSTAPRIVTTRDVFVTGGTGYIGRRVIAALVERGHRVRALVRPASRLRLPQGCTSVVGDAQSPPVGERIIAVPEILEA
jgi:uncharacterized protein YbjT (DUF2867 family)